MEDKQIIEFFYNRSEKAIPEMQEKYGQECAYIASHILPSADEAEVCAKESLQVLWETIPPHRPQNLKAYVCKITRNHALQMKYPDFMEQDVDLFSAELVIHDFLKELEPEQRKLFIAHYWYFTSVAEIATQYRISENKVNMTLDPLRQKLDKALEEKQISFISEEELFFAMTEVEDRYLEEAAPKMEVLSKVAQEEIGKETKILFSQIWKKYRIPAIACIVLLVFVVLIWPKNSEEQKPTGQNQAETNKPNSETTNIDEDNTSVILDDLISISGVGTFHKNDLIQLQAHHPWNEKMEIAALPVYKNLSDVYDGQEDIVEYMDQTTLLEMVSDICAKLNMKAISIKQDEVKIGDGQNGYAICGMQVTTDTGSIQISKRGEVTVSFLDGVQLPAEYEMSDSTTVEHANNKVVAYLMKQYEDIISAPYFASSSYSTYDAYGNRTMHFRAIAHGEGINNVENILDYNFNQVEFYYNQGLGLTSFRYGDIRFATELLGYYPIISLEEAKALLREGNFRSDYFHSGSNGLAYEEEDILAVELMYKTDEWEDVYQPYYIFYILTAVDNTYAKCYVPAIEGVRVDNESEILNPDELLEIFPDEVEIIDTLGYEYLTSFGYYKDEKYYTIENGALKEVETLELFDAKDKYGEMETRYYDDGLLALFYYGEEDVLNLTELMKELAPDKIYDELRAMYIDGKIVVISTVYKYEDSGKVDYATHYLFSLEQNSLTQIMEATPLYREGGQPYGIVYDGGRYISKRNTDGTLWIVDLVDGSSVNTGIQNDDIKFIKNASEEHYAIVYQTGEIAIVEKESGQLIKKSKYQLKVTPSSIRYKDELIYVELISRQVLVIREFE